MSKFWHRHTAAKLYKYHPRYYLGYGSNLNIAQMVKRCPTAKIVCAAELHGYKLVFSSVATIEPEPEASVLCGCWYVEPDDIAALDIYEGYPDLYEKYNCTVTIDGKDEDAFFYALDIAYDMETPSSYYLETVEQGYEDFKLDKTKLAEAILEAHMAEEANDTLSRECCWCGAFYPRQQMHNEGRGSYLCNECYNDMAADLYGYSLTRGSEDYVYADQQFEEDHSAFEHDYYGEPVSGGRQLMLLDDDYAVDSEGNVDPWERDFDPSELDYTPRSRYLYLS